MECECRLEGNSTQKACSLSRDSPKAQVSGESCSAKQIAKVDPSESEELSVIQTGCVDE